MYGATQSAGLDVVVNDDDVEAWHVLIEVFDPWSLSSDAPLIRKPLPDNAPEPPIYGIAPPPVGSDAGFTDTYK